MIIMSPKQRRGYEVVKITLELPKSLVEEFDKLYRTQGFSSRTEAIKYLMLLAIREWRKLSKEVS